VVSPSRPRRTREEQRAETRARLLDAAGEVIAARGLDGASIDEITERAGYTRGAFYSNFPGKPELLVELCEQRLLEYADEIVPLVQAAPAGQRGLEAARLLTERDPRPDVFLLVELARLRATNDAVEALLARFADRFVDLIDDVLATHGTDLGDPTPEQRRAGARGLVAALLGLAFVQHVGLGDDRHTAELLLDGVTRAAFPDAPTHADPR
jgi:AcrR family transcriptional regulator